MGAVGRSPLQDSGNMQRKQQGRASVQHVKLTKLRSPVNPAHPGSLSFH